MKLRGLRCAFVCLAALPLAAQTATPPPAAPDLVELYKLGKQLFDEHAPPEVKAQLEFPSKEQWDAFNARLQRALEGDSLEKLADLLPEARASAKALRAIPGYEDYADWLEQRLDEI